LKSVFPLPKIFFFGSFFSHSILILLVFFPKKRFWGAKTFTSDGKHYFTSATVNEKHAGFLPILLRKIRL
jgi:hypothetical protein